LPELTPPSLQPIGIHHPKVKQVLALARNTAPNPKRLFVAEGLWAHRLLLDSSVEVDSFFWCPEAAYGDEARLRARQLAERAQDAYQISEKTLVRLSERDRPDGLLSIARMPTWFTDDVTFDDSALVVVADAMEIPGNLGTLIRTLNAAGAQCLVLTNRRTRLTHPKVLRASQGTVLRVPTLDFEDTDEAIDWLVGLNFDIYLADTTNAVNYRRIDYRGRRTAFVLGAERYGIAQQWRERDFQRVMVPMLGGADSLNVSISAAVLLFEARAQKSDW
jgi:tRNA G18 (ribose-2'-O)-methylase SpoU